MGAGAQIPSCSLDVAHASIWLMSECKRCGKRWCGTDAKVRELHGDDYAEPSKGLDAQIERVTFGSRKCRGDGPRR